MTLTALCLAVSLSLGDLEQDFVAAFDELQYRSNPQSTDGETFRYRLFCPDTSSGGQFPLIVWLHGFGDSGKNNIGQLKWLDQLVFEPPVDKTRYPFFLLALQCPSDPSAWFQRTGPSDQDMIAINVEILKQLLAERPIDPRRVYLVGISSGGMAALELAYRHPDLIAAIAPLGSWGARGSELVKLRDVPIWAFHSTDDPWSNAEGLRSTVATLRSLGGPAHLTVTNTSGHDCWSAAFQDHHLLDWLLAQQKGSKPSWEPGYEPLKYRLQKQLHGWAWWQIPIQLAVVIAPFLLARYAYVRLVRK